MSRSDGVVEEKSKRDAGVLISREMPLYLDQHSFEVLNYMAVFKTQHLDSRLHQEASAYPIAGLRTCMIMGSAIEFDRQAFARTIKIQHVRADAVLPAEFPAIELTALKMPP